MVNSKFNLFFFFLFPDNTFVEFIYWYIRNIVIFSVIILSIPFSSEISYYHINNFGIKKIYFFQEIKIKRNYFTDSVLSVETESKTYK